MISPYLSDRINDRKIQGEWKIQASMSIKMRPILCIQRLVI